MLRLTAPLAALLALATPHRSAHADEITVYSSTGLRYVLEEAVPLFAQATGHRPKVVLGTATALKKRIDAGETFDVAIFTPVIIRQLVGEGVVTKHSVREMAASGIGVAVKAGAPKPDVSSTEALRKALLGASSVTYASDGQSGAYFLKLLERLEISNQVLARAKPAPGGKELELVARGEAELGIQLVGEIVPMHGVELAGPLPPGTQNLVVLAGAISATTSTPSASKALMDFLTDPSLHPMIAKTGMEPR